MTNRTLFLLALSLAGLTASAQRTETLLERGWRYLRTDVKTYYDPDFDDSKWQTASVPHDWAIKGRFSVDNDDPTGCKTGGLPYSGAGWYRLHFDVPDYEPGRHVELIFDGAMSHPRVYVNGELAGEWEYGYNTFSVDITPYVKASDNVLAVNLYNEKGQSRWYPGAGLYRNVHLIVTDEARIPTWGVQVSRLTLRKARPTSKCARLSSCPKTAAVTASRRR